jgi:hypothetical protein
MFTKTDGQPVWVGGEAEVMVLGANIDRHAGVRQLFDSTHNSVSELKRAGVYTDKRSLAEFCVHMECHSLLQPPACTAP